MAASRDVIPLEPSCKAYFDALYQTWPASTGAVFCSQDCENVAFRRVTSPFELLAISMMVNSPKKRVAGLCGNVGGRR